MISTSSLTCVFHALTDFGTGNKQTNVGTLLHRPLDLNPRTYTQIRTPHRGTRGRGGGRGGWNLFRNETFHLLILEPVLYEVSQLGKPGWPSLPGWLGSCLFSSQNIRLCFIWESGVARLPSCHATGPLKRATPPSHINTTYYNFKSKQGMNRTSPVKRQSAQLTGMAHLI